MDTGFVVLEHDLYAQTVDLAIGYTLPAAQAFTPKLTVSFAIHLSTPTHSIVVFQLDSIGNCNGIPATNLYRETNQNKTFPYPNTTIDATGSSSNGTGGDSKTGGATLSSAISLSAGIAALLALSVSLL